MNEHNSTSLTMYRLCAIAHKILRRHYSSGNNFTSLSRLTLLHILSEQPKTTLKTLSEQMLTSPSSLCITINRMHKENLILKEHNPTDKRKICYSLTDQGQLYLLNEMNKIAGHVDQILERLTTKEQQKLFDLLEQTEEIIKSLEARSKE